MRSSHRIAPQAQPRRRALRRLRHGQITRRDPRCIWVFSRRGNCTKGTRIAQPSPLQFYVSCCDCPPYLCLRDDDTFNDWQPTTATSPPRGRYKETLMDTVSSSATCKAAEERAFCPGQGVVVHLGALSGLFCTVRWYLLRLSHPLGPSVRFPLPATAVGDVPRHWTGCSDPRDFDAATRTNLERWLSSEMGLASQPASHR